MISIVLSGRHCARHSGRLAYQSIHSSSHSLGPFLSCSWVARLTYGFGFPEKIGVELVAGRQSNA